MDGEREAWTEEFRNSNRTLGQVIAHVYTSREAVRAVDELKFIAQTQRCQSVPDGARVAL